MRSRFVSFLTITLTLATVHTNFASGQTIKLDPVYTAHQFSAPLYMVDYPTNPTIKVVLEKNGKAFAIDEGNKTTFLDLSSRASAKGEGGLLSIAFQPQFAIEDGKNLVFISYTADKPFRSVISKAEVNENAAGYPVVDLSTEKVILQVNQPFFNHNGGMILFGPDEMLYFGLGDGGSAGDPQNNAQNLNTLLGKILRLDVLSQATYTIPQDNPFVGKPGVKGEIFAFGLRNPWRFSFVPTKNGTPLIIVGDVGQNTKEEISLVEAGDNLGWKYFEADIRFQNGALPNGFVHKEPVLSLPRSEAASITGGYIYLGDAAPSLKGEYVFADFVTGRIWAMETKKTNPSYRQIGQGATIASLAQDSGGDLYIIEISGNIKKITE